MRFSYASRYPSGIPSRRLPRHSGGHLFCGRLDLHTQRTIEWQDGQTYPYVTLDVSSESHPFYTGKQKVVSSEGRVAKFAQRFGSLVRGTSQEEQ